MKAKTTYVLVADGAHARLLARVGASAALRAVPKGIFAHEVRPTNAMGSDRPGRTQESVGGARHTIEPRVDWSRQEKERFAQRLAAHLEEQVQRHGFDRLILVAPPRFLGDLRAALGPQARKRLEGELDKDLTELAPREIEARLVTAGLLPTSAAA